jgi:(p)ppGpp synthase/HD superfamily hydrolase
MDKITTESSSKPDSEYTEENKTANLERAIELAVRHHKGQVDKAGQAYILHPLRLMLAMSTEREKIVAVLHDIVEDTPITLDDLRKEGFSEMIIAAIECVTKIKGENYDSFIERISHNPLATAVKLADLEDNMDLSRLSEVTEKDLLRVAKYQRAKKVLLEKRG